MKEQVLVYFTVLLVLFATIVQPKRTIEKHGHQLKRHNIIHKPIKPNPISRHKKHDIFTLAAPPSLSSVLPSASHTTLMPNGVPTAVGEYMHHLMHRHPLNIPVYHGYHPHGVYPQHYGPLGPFGHRMFYKPRPWRGSNRLGLGYGIRYPFARGFVHGPWYRHGLGYGYHRRFRHGRWHGLHVGHVPAGVGYGYGHGYRGYGHVNGNWRFHPLRGWYPYSFDHSVDLRGDSSPDTMFIERSSIPAASKGSTLGSKINPRRLLKTRRKSILARRVRLHFPVSVSYPRQPLRRNIIPLGFRIQRFKISLTPLKRKLKHYRSYKKFIKTKMQRGKGKVGRPKKVSHSASKKTKVQV